MASTKATAVTLPGEAKLAIRCSYPIDAQDQQRSTCVGLHVLRDVLPGGVVYSEDAWASGTETRCLKAVASQITSTKVKLMFPRNDYGIETSGLESHAKIRWLMGKFGLSLEEASRVWIRYERNRFGTPGKYAMFHLTEIMPHSCQPNTTVIVSKKDGIMTATVYAVCLIKAGTELTHIYKECVFKSFNVPYSKAERDERLGFHCRCPTCVTNTSPQAPPPLPVKTMQDLLAASSTAAASLAGEGKTKGTKKDEETVEEKKEKKELYPIGLDSWNKKCEDGRFNEFLVNCDAIGLERSNQDRNREAKAESAFRGLSDLVKKMKSDMAEAEAAARGDPKQADKAKELAALREKLDVAAAALPLA